MLKKTTLILLCCFVISTLVTAQTDKLISTHDHTNNYERQTTNIESENISCCVGDRGNIDADPLDKIDISDLVFLVTYMFSFNVSLPCIDEADIAPIESPNGSMDISDLVSLVSYMFNNGPAPSECPPFITIINLQPNDNIVRGKTAVDNPSDFKVVLWAKTNQWYIQPSVASPYTTIQMNGTWENNTYPWERMLALLVDSTYTPEAIRNYHPSLDQGVVGWDEYPDKSLRVIDWNNYNWRVKTGNLVGPGPNYFSDDTLNVWLDESDRMHLKIDYRDSKWNCAEVVLDHSLGYGLYTFKLDSRVDSLDYNTILGCFIYETINQEFDFEFSQRLADPYNAQYVAQPWYNPGNIEFFNMPSDIQTSHSFEWRADSIVFKSWHGHADTSTSATLIHSWTYSGNDIAIPGGERMIFNLYLYGGEEPVTGFEDEIIINSFEYSP